MLFEQSGEFCTVGCFTSALQADHHNDGGRIGGDGDACALTAEQLNQFVVYDFDNLLCGGQAFQDFGIGCLFGDRLDEILCDLEVYIGFEQSQTNFAHCVLDVSFGQTGLTAQFLKGG